MKLFVDDERNPPDDSWTVVRDAWSAMELIEAGEVTDISLDHDLGGTDMDPTGYKVAEFIEQAAWMGAPFVQGLKTMACHSQNPVGAKRIMRALERAQQYLLEDCA